MATARRDDLARRLAERLDKSPVKGRAMKAPAEDVEPGRLGATPGSPAPAQKRSTKTGEARRSKGTTKRPSSDRPARSSAGARDIRTERSSVPTRRPKRGAPGTVLRGHLVPEAVHRDTRHRKVRLRSTRGERVTWDDVMSEGVTLLVDQPDRAAAMIDETGSSDVTSARRRLVQATLTEDLDRRLVEIQLDLSDRSDRTVTYEQLWTAAILLWLGATG